MRKLNIIIWHVLSPDKYREILTKNCARFQAHIIF